MNFGPIFLAAFLGPLVLHAADTDGDGLQPATGVVVASAGGFALDAPLAPNAGLLLRCETRLETTPPGQPRVTCAVCRGSSPTITFTPSSPHPIFRACSPT